MRVGLGLPVSGTWATPESMRHVGPAVLPRATQRGGVECRLRFKAAHPAHAGGADDQITAEVLVHAEYDESEVDPFEQ